MTASVIFTTLSIVLLCSIVWFVIGCIILLKSPVHVNEYTLWDKIRNRTVEFVIVGPLALVIGIIWIIEKIKHHKK